MPDEPSAGWPDWKGYIARVWVAVLIVTLVAGVFWVLWLAYKVALAFFAAVLLAIFLRTLADWVGRFTHLGPNWSLLAAVLGLLVLAALLGWLLVGPITQEVNRLSQELPQAVAQLQAELEHSRWGQSLLAKVRQPSGVLSQAGNLFSQVSNVFSITIEGVVYAWVVLFCGLYLAIQPGFYVRGFLRLLPEGKRPRGRVVLRRIGRGLKHWLFGQIFSMTIIGLLTWLGLHLLRIPLSAALGVLAGVLDFVPVVGPWVAGIISSVLALLVSPIHAVYVAALFVALHLFEGHVLIPLVQKQATRLPPVLTVLAMVLFALLFGFLGLFLATPLLALVLITTQALYVEDVLEERP